jgi:hypothetical protein
MMAKVRHARFHRCVILIFARVSLVSGAAQAALRTLACETMLAVGVWLKKHGLLSIPAVDRLPEPGKDLWTKLEDQILDAASRLSRIQFNDRTIELRKKTDVSLKDLHSGLFDDGAIR